MAMNVGIVTSCPFTGTNNVLPNDVVHPSVRRRRLSDNPNTKKKLDAIIDNRRALLGETECLDETTYDGIVEDIQAASDALLPDNVARGQ